ncbi:TPA: hypothetical protein HA225_04870 [Candidatus Micrarchaeota archaeon]|nr:hypothetical protein [Candidatus Micrarchaeota archaeon]
MNKLCDNCRKQGRVWCPHNAALEIKARLQPGLKREMFGPSPPFLFVGHNFYPKVYWGPLVSEQMVADDPSEMYGMSMEKIIETRASMVRGMKRSGVKEVSRLLDEAQQAVMSIKPVDSESRFTKTPVFSLELDDIAHPVGASAPIEKFKVADNPVIPKKVDELHEDGVLAQEALSELLLEGFDVHYLSKLLTSGILGRHENRKLVPTKWAITATDDIASKQYMESIRDCRELELPLVFSNTYLDNHFEILLLPGSWEYEQFETALTRELEERKKKMQDRAALSYSTSSWADWKYDGRINISEEHELFIGRTEYAESQGGGYYAARFAVCEALYRMRRQARAIVFREIGTGYDVPVGVWEVRENVRHAFLKPPEKFESREKALAHLSEKLSVPIKEYVKRSKVLLQRRITEF